MADIVNDLTSYPVALETYHTVGEAARAMRDHDVGAVFVMNGPEVCGVVTERDIVVQAVADDRSPDSVHLGEICTRDLPSGPIALVSPPIGSRARLARVARPDAEIFSFG